MSVAPRNVTPIIAWLRNLLAGRKLVSVHRFEPFMSPKTPDLPPALPVGVSHAISANSYSDRDGRRFSRPSKLIYDPRALPSGEKSEHEPSATADVKTPKPGFGYDWATGSDVYKP